MALSISTYPTYTAARSTGAHNVEEITMAFTQNITGNTEASVRRSDLGTVLASALGAWMVLLVTVTVVFGLAIQRKVIAPPKLDVRRGRVHLVAYTTHTPDCVWYLTSCPPELIARPRQDFYVIWVLTRTGQSAPPDERETGTRLLTLPLRQP